MTRTEKHRIQALVDDLKIEKKRVEDEFKELHDNKYNALKMKHKNLEKEK